jgi:hypothetical protein
VDVPFAAEGLVPAVGGPRTLTLPVLRSLRIRHETALDEDLTEPLAGLTLSLRRVLELLSRK